MKRDDLIFDIIEKEHQRQLKERQENITSELIWLLKRIKKLLDTSDQM